MTVFRPCIGCIARSDCEIKKGVVKAMRGQPVTSAKIKCELPFTRDFPPGTRVKVKVWDAREFTAGMGETPAKMAPATVVGPSSKKAGKLLMHLDEKVQTSLPGAEGEPTTIEFRAAWPKEVERLDEPRREHCDSCRRAFVHGQCSCPLDMGAGCG